MDYFQGVNAYNLLGVKPPPPGNSPAGEQLPRVSNTGGDNAMVPWHHDSPHFWFMALGAAAVLGIVGASVDVRAGRRHAKASVGEK